MCNPLPFLKEEDICEGPMSQLVSPEGDCGLWFEIPSGRGQNDRRIGGIFQDLDDSVAKRFLIDGDDEVDRNDLSGVSRKSAEVANLSDLNLVVIRRVVDSQSLRDLAEEFVAIYLVQNTFLNR